MLTRVDRAQYNKEVQGIIKLYSHLGVLLMPEEFNKPEYEIPPEDANALLDDLCEKPLIEKNRYKIQYGGFTWEVDEFFGENDGLVVAEIELESEDQSFDKPEWVGEEVTGDVRYFNSNLIREPYSQWK